MTVSARPAPTRRRGPLVVLAALVVAAVLAAAILYASADEPGPVETGYAGDCLAVGAAANEDGRADGPQLAIFRAVDDAMGPLTIRRSFEPGLPASFAESSAATDGDAGLRSFVSWKPPDGDFRGAAAGVYDDRIRAWARSVPRTGVFATAFHEPENNMTGPEFVALQRHLYRVVKAANPTIRWGPVYMAYWWDPEQTDHWIGDPDEWWPGEEYADFAALDWYGVDPAPMTESRSFTTWYDFVEPIGLPLYIAEYGQYIRRPGEASDPAKERARAEAIRQDAEWIREHRRISMWIYWHGTDRNGDWRLHDEESQRAWREVAATGCRPDAPPAGGTAAALAEPD
jgi:hypothetical protein